MICKQQYTSQDGADDDGGGEASGDGDAVGGDDWNIGGGAADADENEAGAGAGTEDVDDGSFAVRATTTPLVVIFDLILSPTPQRKQRQQGQRSINDLDPSNKYTCLASYFLNSLYFSRGKPSFSY